MKMTDGSTVYYIPVQSDETTGYSPEIDEAVTNNPDYFTGHLTISDDEDPIILTIKPQLLKDMADFRELYILNPQWAEALVVYHPEYPYYESCASDYQEIYNAKTDLGFGGDLDGTETLSSDEFDKMICEIGTWENAKNGIVIIANNEYDSDIDFTAVPISQTISGTIAEHDPFFKYLAEEGLTDYIDAMALALYENYQNNGLSGGDYVEYNMYEMASTVVKCANYYGDIGSPTDEYCKNWGEPAEQQGEPAENIEFRNKQWQSFRSFYISYKQKFKRQLAQANAIADGRINDCIGNENTISTGTNWNESCNCIFWRAGWFRWLKEKRFPDPDDIFSNAQGTSTEDEPLDEFVDDVMSQVEYEYYLNTGECALSQSVQLIIEDFRSRFTDGKIEDRSLANLFNQIPNPNIMAFTSGLYDYLKEIDGYLVTHTDHVNYQWETNVDGNTVTFNFYNPELLTYPCHIEIYYETDPGTTEVISFSNIHFTQVDGSDHEFTIDVLIQDGDEEELVTLHGSTCFPIGNCQPEVNNDYFENICYPNDEATGLLYLMSELAQNNELTNTTGVTLWDSDGNLDNSDPLEYYFYNYLGSWFNTDAPNVWQWRRTVSGSDEFEIFSPGTNPEILTITFYDGFDYDNIEVFTHVVPLDETDVNGNNFEMGAVLNGYDEVSLTKAEYNSNPFSMGDCQPSAPFSCSGNEYIMKDLMIIFLQSLVDDTSPFNDYDLLDSDGTPDLRQNPAFTNLMESELAFGYEYNWIADQISDYALSARIFSDEAGTECNFEFNFVEQDVMPAFTINDITGFAEIWVDNNNSMFSDEGTGFTVSATDGTDWENIYITSCYNMMECTTIHDCDEYELITNGDFEQDFTNWTYNTHASIKSIDQECDEFSSKYAALRVYDEYIDEHKGYIQQPLDEELVGGQTYELKMNIKLVTYPPHSGWDASINFLGIGMYFTGDDIPLPDDDVISLPDNGLPQFMYSFNNTNEVCYEISQLFVAEGGEEYVTIGNFDDENTIFCSEVNRPKNIFFIVDEVSVKRHCPELPNIILPPIVPEDPCDCECECEEYYTWLAEQEYEENLAEMITEFKENYISECMGDAIEKLYRSYVLNEYHYTLYYYDKAGNLVRTVPPKGVDLDLVNEPDHSYHTTYKYNSQNQPVWQETPDAGVIKYWYDKIGRLVASQNAQQAETNYIYSYTKYDEQNRIIEVGEMELGSLLPDDPTHDDLNDDNYPDNISGISKSQITSTKYDEPLLTQDELDYVFGTGVTGSGEQKHLRSRVACISIDHDGDGTYENATHYSYDFHGNVNVLVQDNKLLESIGGEIYGNRFKKIIYDYDLVSGNVLQVSYQPGKNDAFYHRYEYDADNRIINVWTSDNNITWDEDAHYFYYLHGPLARVELAENKTQGMDYFYTLQGWLKGVNITDIDPATDIGNDGLYTDNTNPHKYFGSDQYAFALGYYENDYTPVGTGIDLGGLYSGVWNDISTARQLFNGNIGFKINDIVSAQDNPLLAAGYNYDQLNRITRAEGYSHDGSIFHQPTTAYTTGYNYDANGNITELNRQDQNGSSVDRLAYRYNPDKNQLDHVEDIVPSGSFNYDIDNQDIGNYDYDKIGNLIKDESEDISNIEWTVYGKVKKVNRPWASNSHRIKYSYDGNGNRIMKLVSPFEANLDEYTWYVRDASGNIMSIYKTTYQDALGGGYDEIFTQTQLPIYGSNRVGTYNTDKIISIEKADGTDIDYFEEPDHFLGKKRFELGNHLGNVVVVLSDKKIAVDSDDPPDGIIDYYEADVLAYYDYYSGVGMTMPGRVFESTDYRFGAQGSEVDKEVNGTRNTITTFYRQGDLRSMRWWSTDPKPHPSWSPYAMFDCNPVLYNDVLGDTTYRFSQAGKYIGRFDLKESGIIGSIGSFQDYDIGDETKSVWTGDYFAFNDPSVDIYQLNLLQVGEQALQVVSEENINDIMNQSDINKRNPVSRTYFALTESGSERFSGGNKMDFGIRYLGGVSGGGSNDLAGGFFMFEGKSTAYNAMDAGNWLWGQGMQRLGFSYGTTEAASQANEWFQDPQGDQRAIFSGYEYNVGTEESEPFELNN